MAKYQIPTPPPYFGHHSCGCCEAALELLCWFLLELIQELRDSISCLKLCSS
jgi:hypothetical protein